MRRLSRPALLVFLAAIAVATTAFVMLGRSGIDARRHAELVATFDAMAQAETSLDRDLLQVMAGLLPHYDTVVAHSSTLQGLFVRLEGGEDWPELPHDALANYRRLVEAKLAASEQIKAVAAFVRKEGSYLPFAVQRYVETAEGKVGLSVQDAMIALLSDDPEDAGLAGPLARFAAAADPALRGIGQHMQALMEQRQALHEATDEYFAIDSHAALEHAREQYMAAFGLRQDRLATLTRGLQVLTVALFVGLGLTISRLGRAHERAELAHGQLVDAVDSLQEAFALFDHGRRLVLCNARYDSLFPGHGRIDGFRNLLAVLRAHAVEGNVAADQGSAMEMLVANPADGRTHLFRSHPTSDHGSVCLFTDLTEHRRVEAQIRKLTAAVEQSPVAIVITDADSCMEYVNPRFLELTGYGMDEVIGQTPRLLKSGEVRASVYEEMWKTISAGLTWRGELINRKKNGELFWESTTISPIRDATGRITNYVALKEDITQHKRNVDLLIDANADIERMLFAASHDLQEPVRLMQTYCQKLTRQLPGDAGADARESMGFIVEAARQLGHLISGLTTYSRSGRPTDAFGPVDCAAVVNRALAECLALAEQQNPHVRMGPLPVVQGDPVLLVMLFENLIGNALKFRHPARSPEIVVTAEHDGAGWRIDVADNGIGIEAQYLPTITQPFSRLYPRATHPGAGLGLASCLKIAKVHGGRLWLDSVPNAGTTVHVWLPAGARVEEDRTAVAVD
ncbi:MAG: PAS domain S-box protein [Magnetospirillum sp.]|nr:PAS domain S-box protein [Magnetospirillum sp.]